MTEKVFVPATRAAVGRQSGVGVAGGDADRVGGGDRVPVGVDRVDGDVEALPAVCALGVPVLPVAVPGAAVSPGIRIWSFANAPALMVVAGLVFAVIEPLVTSVAVNVAGRRSSA